MPGFGIAVHGAGGALHAVFGLPSPKSKRYSSGSESASVAHLADAVSEPPGESGLAESGRGVAVSSGCAWRMILPTLALVEKVNCSRRCRCRQRP